MSKILITGGSGLIGTELSELLTEQGHEVCWLSRQVKTQHRFKSYYWDASDNIDTTAFEGVSVVIHLAGAGVFDRRWNATYKQTILDSRVQSTRFLMESIKKYGTSVKRVIGSSPSGYYGGHLHDQPFDESAASGTDFLAKVCQAWEYAYMHNCPTGVSLALVRTGIVLSPKGGAYKRLRTLFKFGVGSPMGTGRQIMPWIHSLDLCRLYMQLVESSVEGPFNGVGPEKISNRDFSKQLAEQLAHGWMLPAVPSLLLQFVLGESATVLTTGAALSTQKVTSLPFQFRYTSLRDALKQLESNN